ncbi:MAG: hypothetical protein PVH98_05155 [Gammaproteobacteria bacterium]|jgi:hypothetical protein
MSKHYSNPSIRENHEPRRGHKLIKLVTLCVLLSPLFDVAFAQTTAQDDGSLRQWINSLVIPNIPGAVLLLVMSILISMLTFYSDLKRSQIPGKGSIRYLALWIFGNYIFALLLLVLIMPEGKGLNELDRTLLLYCILAAGMPELSAYLKIQLGNSERGINLYKFREMFTNYISRRVDTLSERSEWQEIQLFKNAFTGMSGQLDEKLITFANVCDFPDDQKTAILECLPSANNNDIDTAVDRLLSLGNDIQEKIFIYFKEDIRRYQSSSRARLIKTLYPPVNVQEADTLVMNGIISPFRFFMKTLGPSRREKLATVTHIESNKLALIHNEMKGVLRSRVRRFMLGTLMVFLFLVLTSLIVGTQMEQSLTTANIVLEAEKPLSEAVTVQ